MHLFAGHDVGKLACCGSFGGVHYHVGDVVVGVIRPTIPVAVHQVVVDCVVGLRGLGVALRRRLVQLHACYEGDKQPTVI